MAIKKHNSPKIWRMNLGSHLTLGVWSMIVLFPLWVMFINSFKDRLSIYKNTYGLPEVWHFSNYTDVLRSGDFLNYFKNSFLAVGVSLALVMFFGALASYALSRWRGKLPGLIYLFFIVGMMLPIKIASIKLLEMVRDLGLLNTVWALVPIYVAMGIPVAVFVLTEFMRQVPKELYEAALIDGAGPFKIFMTINIPLMRPALATVGIYNMVPFWNDLWFPLIFISDERSKTLLLGVTRLFGQYQTDWSKVLAVLTLSSIPVLALYLIFSKHFIKGLTAGSVKG
ncbi:MAG: carbohydrate ABC transporter permease [Gracilibacteraceae bacterium]|jgi:raffinose/stachyose/melibiose transport system permease protein|nr:carbohydrate ABC transporter permease [Gracilibacteraceae bacterium]